MHRYFILEGREVVPCDMKTWAIWYDDPAINRHVALTEVVAGVEISTIFLGMNQNFGEGPPLIFETMGFDDYGSNFRYRYSTWAEAELGHMEIVERITALLADNASI